MYYTYILKSHKDQNFYTGFTTNLTKRLAQHNGGMVKSTKGRVPLELVCYIGFSSKEKALLMEKHLKSSSGKAFMYKRLVDKFQIV